MGRFRGEKKKVKRRIESKIIKEALIMGEKGVKANKGSIWPSAFFNSLSRSTKPRRQSVSFFLLSRSFSPSFSFSPCSPYSLLVVAVHSRLWLSLRVSGFHVQIPSTHHTVTSSV